MLQKVMCGYTTPISKFKSNPNAAIAEADGDAVAVSSHNEIQFYAVPASLYEEMISLVERSQSGSADLKSIAGKFHLTKEMVNAMTVRLKSMSEVDCDDFIECGKNN